MCAEPQQSNIEIADELLFIREKHLFYNKLRRFARRYTAAVISEET